MRWKAWIGGLASALAIVGGCKQRIFLDKGDYAHYQNIMPANLETDPCATVNPTIDRVGKPPTVDDTERAIRYISLSEAIAIALEQGTIGNQTAPLANATGSFIATDQPVVFGGRAISPTDAIRVLALDPAIVGANIEIALSKFDAVLSSSMSWQNTDRPIGTSLDVFQTGNSGVNAIEQHDANFSTTIQKPLASGGVAGITFAVPYTLTNLPAAVNPAYRPSLQFAFEQPLLQGYGVEINQLRAAHPGSILQPGLINNFAGNAEGILVTRIRFDQQRAEFERLVQIQVANVEFAYWNLYNSYWTLYAREAAMRQAFEAWKISNAKYQAGRASIADLAQTRGQFELFRDQRIGALNDVLENERQLRAMLGMHIEDGFRLVPSDSPTLAPFTPDWNTALEEALNLRPELYMARQEVKANQMNIILAKNNLLPDLRFTSTYDINSIGNQLDGAGPENAFRNLASNHFNNWSLGLRLNVPIGFRNAHANLRIARLQLARSYALLQDNELKVERLLGAQYRKIFTNYEQIRARRAQREAFADQLRARFQEFLAGRGTLDLLLEAQRFWADALSNEYTAIAEYNKSLAAFQFAKGTILQHDNVVISEGALPVAAQVRAVEHQRERTVAKVCLERAQPVDHTPFKDGTAPCMPDLPNDKAPSLPSLLEKAPTVPNGTSSERMGTPTTAAPASANPVVPATAAPAVPTAAAPTVPAAAATSSSAKKTRKKSDPRLPTDFGALRPPSEGASDGPKPPPVQGTIPTIGAAPAALPPIATGTTAPALPANGLPSVPEPMLPTLSTK